LVVHNSVYKHNIIHHNRCVVLVVTVVDQIVIVDDDVAVDDLIVIVDDIEVFNIHHHNLYTMIIISLITIVCYDLMRIELIR
jgi:hypothetical protein